MSEVIELKESERAQEGAGEPLDNNNCREERGAKEQENVDDSFSQATPEEEIKLHLLPQVKLFQSLPFHLFAKLRKGAASNGSQHTVESQINISVDQHGVNAQESSRQKNRKNERIQWIASSLNEKVFWKLKLWMIIVIIFLIIALVIILSLVICSVTYDDEDEKFDRGLFTVPRFYSGKFKLANQEFTEKLLSPSSPQSQNLSAQLKEKLSDLYSSSPALGRYFFGAGVSSFSNGSIVAHYWLKFHLPSEHNDLLQYTVSLEMVFNILRQHLYDQDPDLQDPLYIDPTSLQMEVGNGTLTNE